MVAEFSYCLGQPWEYVDEHLTVEQINAYRRYWHQNPPTHILAAGFMGYKPREAGSLDDIALSLGARPVDGK